MNKNNKWKNNLKIVVKIKMLSNQNQIKIKKLNYNVKNQMKIKKVNKMNQIAISI